ncbi:DUF3373 domain-containing protein [Geobacter argillaceus]|uniref:Uncharacterized protein DUF3373 n=1 Tax=Geobacter argillaceus TaxID=345631 RepID=A0A562WSZ4_9BACT|nr:DUF3373 domain-containing protein [Geobacter argillaceus]TWJ33476.1 uncharacterized protein DUF3373 [Geobacter argillaceus]
MKKTGKQFLTGALLAGLVMPAAALAADQDLEKKIDSLSKEIDVLKQQVKKTEDKSLGKWLTIGGDYRFRVDSLRGESKPYVDVNATFNNAQQQMNNSFIASPVAAGPQVAAFLNFANSMKQVSTVSGAQTFLGNNATMLGALQGFAKSIPAAKPSNDTLYTNRLGLDLHAKATQDVTVNVRLLMYKTFGSDNDSAVTGSGGTPFFADRVGVFDGTIGHVPSSDFLGVDRAYATWANIAGEPVWISVGRRPSTNGVPSNLRLNNERPGNGGTPSLLVDYAFDGMTLGWAPDIDALPGAYAKICYGRGFEAGISQPVGNTLRDTDMLGVAVIPIDTDPLRIHLQWNHGYNIFDFPVMNNTYFGNTAPAVQLGDIDWFGTGVMSTLKNVGPGTLNFFTEFGLSLTHPNDNVSANAGFQGLMTGRFFNPEAPTDKTGWAAYVGARYDLPTKTKLGFEYNHGSRNWITFAPAADDIWTSKVGTRGNVYEGYIIQELNLKPISSYLSKTFFRVGYQYYDFEYTGSNNWVGAPQRISDLTGAEMQLLAPLKSAQNIYGTFEVKF